MIDRTCSCESGQPINRLARNTVVDAAGSCGVYVGVCDACYRSDMHSTLIFPNEGRKAILRALLALLTSPAPLGGSTADPRAVAVLTARAKELEGR